MDCFVESLEQKADHALVADLSEGPGHDRVDLLVLQQRDKNRDRSRIAKVAQQMGGIVAVCANLGFRVQLSPVMTPRGRSDWSVKMSVMTLEPTRVAKPTENERSVSSYVSVLVTQPGRQGWEHARVLTGDDLSCDRELSPKDLFALELFTSAADESVLSTVGVGASRGATNTTSSWLPSSWPGRQLRVSGGGNAWQDAPRSAPGPRRRAEADVGEGRRRKIVELHARLSSSELSVESGAPLPVTSPDLYHRPDVLES